VTHSQAPSDEGRAALPSLFIVSLPRSLSSLIYTVASNALELRTPAWTSDGEILNLDRHFLMGRPQGRPSRKFLAVTPDSADRPNVCAFLDESAAPLGFAYKDVVQPFVIAAWAGLARYRVLKITRDVAEVAHSMLERGWYYPAVAAQELPGGPGRAFASHCLWRVGMRRLTHRDTHDRWTARLLRDDLLVGLLLAERALASIEGQTLAYADALRDPEALRTALERLYPGVEVPRLAYLDEDFARSRSVVEERMRSKQVARLRKRAEELRATLEAQAGNPARP
jgi:hypothetical protein